MALASVGMLDCAVPALDGLSSSGFKLANCCAVTIFQIIASIAYVRAFCVVQPAVAVHTGSRVDSTVLMSPSGGGVVFAFCNSFSKAFVY